MMKRLFDLLLGVVVLAILALPILVVAFAVRVTSKGPVLYWSDRVGIHNQIFKMLHNCGNSSRLVLRIKEPICVRCE